MSVSNYRLMRELPTLAELKAGCLDERYKDSADPEKPRRQRKRAVPSAPDPHCFLVTGYGQRSDSHRWRASCDVRWFCVCVHLDIWHMSTLLTEQVLDESPSQHIT